MKALIVKSKTLNYITLLYTEKESFKKVVFDHKENHSYIFVVSTGFSLKKTTNNWTESKAINQPWPQVIDGVTKISHHYKWLPVAECPPSEMYNGYTCMAMRMFS